MLLIVNCFLPLLDSSGRFQIVKPRKVILENSISLVLQFTDQVVIDFLLFRCFLDNLAKCFVDLVKLDTIV